MISGQWHGRAELFVEGAENQRFRKIVLSLAVEGAVEVEEDGPEDGCGEEDGGEFAAGSECELRGGVRAVEFAEAVFASGAPAALAGGAEVQALRGGNSWARCQIRVHSGGLRSALLIQ